MKSVVLPRSLTDLLLMFFVMWVGSYACEYFFTVVGMKPVFSYIAIIGVAMMYLLGSGAARRNIDILQDLWQRRFFVWLICYGIFGALTFVASSQSEIAVQSLITLIEVSLVAASFQLLMSNSKRYHLVQASLVLLALFSAAMNIFDFVTPTFSNVPGRGAGLYVNPTTAGYMVAFAMVGGVETLPRRLRTFFVLFCGVGILVTFTRSAWILWGVGVVWMGTRNTGLMTRHRLLLGAAALLFGAGALFALFAGDVGDLVMQTPIAHYLDANTSSRLGVGASSISGDSADQRSDVALFALVSAGESPLIGSGIGYTNEWAFPVGPHNMYLLFLVEGGVFGLFLYLALLLLLWRATLGTGRAIVLLIIIAGLFSHNLLDQPAVFMMMVIGLAHGSDHRRHLREHEVSRTLTVPV